MITYNHEGVIADALDSAIRQRTTFPFEIVIGEDCSTDRTREVVLDYQRRYPNLIRALLPERNLGMLENNRQTFAACRGEYVAALEGDDYWTCDDKLQKQVDYLDSHPECAMCYHSVSVADQLSGAAPRKMPVNPKPVATIEDLLPFNFVPTCSAMWRSAHLEWLPDWCAEVKFTDWMINVFNARHGSIGFIDECMGVYRLHSGGTWSTQRPQEHTERWLKAYAKMNDHLGGKYRAILDQAAFGRRYWFATDCLERRNPDALKHVKAAVCAAPLFGNLNSRRDSLRPRTPPASFGWAAP